MGCSCCSAHVSSPAGISAHSPLIHQQPEEQPSAASPACYSAHASFPAGISGHSPLRHPQPDEQPSAANPTQGLLAKKALLELWQELLLHQTLCCSQAFPSTSDDLGRLLGDYADLHPDDGVPKTVSAQGAVCLARVECRVSKYTGLFRRADYGLLRCSSALPTKLESPCCPMMSNAPGTLGKSVVMPFVALKIFRSGCGSGNLLFGGRKTGQEEQNFFANCVCTHMTERCSMVLWPVLRMFRKYSAYPCQSGLSDFAATSQSGEAVHSPVFPWVLTLRPVYQAAHGIEGQNFLHQLSNVEPGTALYQIIACATPDDAKAGLQEEIGTITTVSHFIESSLESRLRFRHQLKEEDYGLRPEWKQQLTAAHLNYGWEHFGKFSRKTSKWSARGIFPVDVAGAWGY